MGVGGLWRLVNGCYCCVFEFWVICGFELKLGFVVLASYLFVVFKFLLGFAFVDFGWFGWAGFVCVCCCDLICLL